MDKEINPDGKIISNKEITIIAKVQRVLIDQRKCWNTGNIDGFMKGYWNSEKLVFASAKHQPTYGWEATLNRYKESYPTKESMGVFNYTIKNITLLTDSLVKIEGQWELKRLNDNPLGNFYLTLGKFNEEWLIIKDSTTSY
ncbi:MAG: hypothetical protein MK207_14755 [Saprospiraceae bacterium]|nr:hypothetical protein [Saprospiraceae bacterium]